MRFRGLLQACHFGPTLLVTSISFGFALHYWSAFEAIAIAVAVLSGQLIVGWSNDLHDYQDDLSHNRSKKPLVSGLLSQKFLKRALFLMLPISFAINLLGPLGIKGGVLYFLGIAFGVLYNFYFKYNFYHHCLMQWALQFCHPVSQSQRMKHHRPGCGSVVRSLEWRRTLLM